MAWYLNYASTGRSISLTSQIPAPVSSFSVEYTIAISGSSAWSNVLLNTANSNNAGSFGSQRDSSNNRVNVYFTLDGKARVIHIITAGFTQGTPFTVKVEWDSTSKQINIYQNNVLSGTYNNYNTFNMLPFTSLTQDFVGALYGIKFTVDGVVYNYDPSASGGTGAILPDIVSANNGTQVGTWPANDGEWIYYNSVTNTRSLYPLNIPANTPVSINLNDYFSGATSYAIQSGSLPAGLTLSGSIISGTVAANAASQFVIRASNSIDLLDVTTVVQVATNWMLRVPSNIGPILQFSSGISTGAVSFKVEFDFAFNSTTGAAAYLQSDTPLSTSDGAFRIEKDASNVLNVVTTLNGKARVITPVTGAVAGTRLTLTVEWDNTSQNIVIRKDATAVATLTGYTVFNMANILGLLNSSFSSPCDIYGVRFYRNGSLVNNYNPINTYSGLTLVDTVGGNNATQSGSWPSDNLKWIGYGQASGNWYLNNATGANSAVSIPSVSIGNNIGDYIEIKAVANAGNVSGIYRLVGITSGYSALIGVEPTKLSISISGSNTQITTGYTQPAIGEIFTVKLRKSGTNQYTASMNGVDFAPFSGFGVFTIDQFFRWQTESTGGFRGGVYYVAISTNGGASATRYYDANASGGSGTALIDTVSGQNGTQAGTWPADNSEWVFIPPAPPVGATPTQIKLFDGTAFQNRTIKRWNGSAFVDVTLKRWNGSAFVDL